MKNIIISEKQLETLTNLVKQNVKEDDRQEDSMAQKTIIYNCNFNLQNVGNDGRR